MRPISTTSTSDRQGRRPFLAGAPFLAALEKFPSAKWNQILAINLSSGFHTTRLVLPSMRVSKWGRIINVASEDGITCSAICPGYVYTPLVEAQIEDQARAHNIRASTSS